MKRPVEPSATVFSSTGSPTGDGQPTGLSILMGTPSHCQDRSACVTGISCDDQLVDSLLFFPVCCRYMAAVSPGLQGVHDFPLFRSLQHGCLLCLDLLLEP